MDISTSDILNEVNAAPEAETAPVAETQAGPVETAPAAEPVQEFEYTANGKTIKEPLDAILKRASQGYNYAQAMQELKAKQGETEQKYNKALELETKYGEIDKYATEHPEWNEHLQEAWQKRFDITGGVADKVGAEPVPSHLSQKINELEGFVSEIKAQKADEAYQRAVDQVKSQFSDIDFSATDPSSGKTLEAQVLEYANENQIGKFEPAFKAFYHDKLIERTRLQAKDQAAADIQQRAKAGIIGSSPTPTRAVSKAAPNLKAMNYNEIADFIKQNEL